MSEVPMQKGVVLFGEFPVEPEELARWLKASSIPLTIIPRLEDLPGLIEKDQSVVLLLHAEEFLKSHSLVQELQGDCPFVKVAVLIEPDEREVLASVLNAGAHDCFSSKGRDALVTCVQKLQYLSSLDEPYRQRRIQETVSKIREEQQESLEAFSTPGIIARSEAMQEVFRIIERVAPFDTTVLIRGDSGTGKELVARALHQNSRRRFGPFIPINCGAIPEHLLESELFGHAAGAFTDATRDKPGMFEEAHGGTIFLDEVGEMPVHLQVKLLRALQEKRIQRVGEEILRPVDIRIVAATLRDLERDVESGRFREDLFYRVNVVSIWLPALQERGDDVDLLCDHFLEKHSERLGLPALPLSDEARVVLRTYPWPGNVRELENCIERALVLCQGTQIAGTDFPERVRDFAKVQREHSPITGQGLLLESGNLSVKQQVRQLEKFLIQRALEETEGNRTHAAKLLEISHRALLYKLKEYGMEAVGK